MPRRLGKVYHVADAANWSRIREEGLISTAVRLSDPRVGEDVRSAVRTFRPRSVEAAGLGYVRDQAPMPPAALAGCLDDGLTPADWYALVNAHVFFWTDEARLRRHLKALAPRPQLVMALDGDALADAHRSRAFVTPFNIGAARRRPARRGLRTLVPVPRWRDAEWSDEAPAGGRARSPSHPPAELLIRDAAPDAWSFVLEIHASTGA